eukprot:CAMPEP_0184391466 /NCGR_PEP_ID=MMETSP0007-20130409/14124_1 /TAXON_ID=97485 /ORGANISM="Prymnesium parvum, Strain Texoma1" /LENGTH=64 /DNA_ID=CAMNT_0026741591 /DNA_START=486 /DNA_END=681 /DNA_ORIENTATION=+
MRAKGSLLVVQEGHQRVEVNGIQLSTQFEQLAVFVSKLHPERRARSSAQEYSPAGLERAFERPV